LAETGYWREPGILSAMPLYEYKCKKGHTFDVIQSFSDDPITKCEICGAKCERVLSAPSIHFKGSGFYNTDYGTKRRAAEKAAHDSSKSKSSDSSSSSSDSSSSSADNGSSKSDKSEPKKKTEAATASSAKKD
jgi:putative FmdB family regulatory protein